MTASPPARWVLKIQGRLLGSQSNRTSVPPKMTSFFEKIVISRRCETVTWDRNSQTPQQLLAVPCTAALVRGLGQQQTKLSKLITPGSIDQSHEQDRALQLIDATASAGVLKGLVDCDGIEYASEGDEEETIQVVFFPAYKIPHFTVRWHPTLIESGLATKLDFNYIQLK